MLKVQSLNIRYADNTVVHNFSLDVKEGEVVSIIGPNGSGKSTILKAMTRLIPCEKRPGMHCRTGAALAQHEASVPSYVHALPVERQSGGHDGRRTGQLRPHAA